MINKLTNEQVKKLHEVIMNEFGGKSAYRDEGELLDSALNSPFQTFGGVDLNYSIIDKASKLYYSLCNNHCFTDGNKRIASLCMVMFLDINGFNTNFTNDDLYDFTLKVASNKVSFDDIKKFIESYVTN